MNQLTDVSLLPAAFGIVVVLGGVLILKLHPILSLLAATAIVIAMTEPGIHQSVRQGLWVQAELKKTPLTEQTEELIAGLRSRVPEFPRPATGTQIGRSVGEAAAKLALPILFASIIGCGLLHSGAARRVVGSITSVAGPQQLPIAMSVSSFVLAIPIYFDSVFYLLVPLAKAAPRGTKTSYLGLVLAVVVGGTMAHSLVPPTPGPLLVAQQLGVPVTSMMFAGLLLGVVTTLTGLAYARWISSRLAVEPPEELEDSGTEAPSETEAGPNLGISLLPIIAPLILLAIGTFADERVWGVSLCKDYAAVLGLSAVMSLGLLTKFVDKERRGSLVANAVADAGVIILLTACGAAFGSALRDSGIGIWLTDRIEGQTASTMILPMAFGLTVLMRAAQGSATVAMLTSSAIVGPMIAAGLPFNPVFLALAIGCGSKPLPWMNDSGFWLVGRLSGMTPKQTLQTFSVALTLMGMAGFGVTWLVAILTTLG
ncbi:MAG: SLC13 family permease [Planctomycetota bacterium]